MKIAQIKTAIIPPESSVHKPNRKDTAEMIWGIMATKPNRKNKANNFSTTLKKFHSVIAC